jgi:hypothetical protein
MLPLFTFVLCAKVGEKKTLSAHKASLLELKLPFVSNKQTTRKRRVSNVAGII